jgi:transposase
LERLAKETGEARLLRRALALLWLDTGETPSVIAARLRVSRQIVYGWAQRFGVRPGRLSARLADAPRSGRPGRISAAIDPLLDLLVDQDPRQYGHAATTWTAPLLRQHLQEAEGVAASERSVRLALRRLGLRWKRPRHRLALRPSTWRQAKGGSNAVCPDVPARCC